MEDIWCFTNDCATSGKFGTTSPKAEIRNKEVAELNWNREAQIRSKINIGSIYKNLDVKKSLEKITLSFARIKISYFLYFDEIFNHIR